MSRLTNDKIPLNGLSAFQVLDAITLALEKYGKTNVTFEVDYTDEYGIISGNCFLECQRPMTELEREEANARDALYQQQRDNYEKAQYDRLKAKFGG